jgi:hypothetical protein
MVKGKLKKGIEIFPFLLNFFLQFAKIIMTLLVEFFIIY